MHAAGMAFALLPHHYYLPIAFYSLLVLAWFHPFIFKKTLWRFSAFPFAHFHCLLSLTVWFYAFILLPLYSL